MPRLVLPGLLAFAALFWAAQASASPAVTLAVVLASQLAFCHGWSRLDLPVAGPSALLILGIAAVVDGAVLLIGPDRSIDTASGAATGVLGIAVLLAFAVQLSRHDGRVDVTRSGAATITGLLICGGRCWVGAAGRR